MLVGLLATASSSSTEISLPIPTVIIWTPWFSLSLWALLMAVEIFRQENLEQGRLMIVDEPCCSVKL